MDETQRTNGRLFYLPRCETIRQQVGLTIAKLAQKANVDRATVTKIERHQGATGAKVGSVFTALNELSKGALVYEVEVTDLPAGRKK